MIQLQCVDCGWKSELYPNGTLIATPGGTLSCPNCEKNGVNGPGIESSYGSVDVVSVSPFQGWKMSHSRRQHLIHYFTDNKVLCGQKVSSEGDYIIKEYWMDSFSARCLRDWNKQFCPKCESKLASKSVNPTKS
jgi:hypothetical protein